MSEEFLLSKYNLTMPLEAIEKRDILFQTWNKTEQSVLLPAERWEKNKRYASIFSFGSVVTMLISIFLIIPGFFIVPYGVRTYSRRKKLQLKIMEQQKVISQTLPIKVSKEDFTKISKTEVGSKLVSNGLLFYLEEEPVF